MSCTIIILELFSVVHPKHFDMAPSHFQTDTALSSRMTLIIMKVSPLISKFSLAYLFNVLWLELIDKTSHFKLLYLFKKYILLTREIAEHGETARVSIIRWSTNVEHFDIMLPVGSGLIL